MALCIKETEFVSAEGLNPVSDESKTINVSASFSPQAKNKIYATLMLWKKSGETWTAEELMPVTLKNTSAGVEVILKDGSSKVIN